MPARRGLGLGGHRRRGGQSAGPRAGAGLSRADAPARVVGTAGHIDHGKSTLVRALTGTDPDRLPEEKRRGMTIDLGFASWQLPSGLRVGVVDVPGHRRFVRTVVAGAQGVDLVLLVVAANEAVMPQTREHLSICEHLGVHRAVVALTKADLVDGETVALARAEVEELLERSRLAGAPIVGCSAVSGEGLAELAATVDAALAQLPARPDRDSPRLFIDRAFSMPGFGPVVTGTLEGGSLAVDEEVAILPAGLRGRVRGLQRHGERVQRLLPGMRAAVNLGGVERRQLARGMALAHPGAVVPTRRIDCWIEIDDGHAAARHGAHLEVHLGTAEVAAALWLLRDSEVEPGSSALVQLQLAEPLVAVPGDRFVLRRAAASATIGGGVVLDVAPRRHRRRDAAVEAALRHRLEGGPDAFVLEELRAQRLGAEPAALAARTGLGLGPLAVVLSGLGAAVARVGRRWFAAERWSELLDLAVARVAAHHQAAPLSPGLPRDELAQSLRLGRQPGGLLDALVGAGRVEERRGHLAIPGRARPPALAEREDVRSVIALLEARGLDAPAPDELRAAGLTPELQALMAGEGLLVRLRDGIVLAADTYAAGRDAVMAHLREHGEATVAELRDRLGATRRVVVPLLERLDSDRVTARRGDLRRLRGAGHQG